MGSHRPGEGDGDSVFARLPVRRIEATPEVAERLRGDVPDSSPGSVVPGGRPGVKGFPWARDHAPRDDDVHAGGGAQASEDLRPSPAAGEGSAEISGGVVPMPHPSGEDVEDGLTDWQRQWLDEGDTDSTDDEEAHLHPESAGWWEGIPAVRQLLLDGLDLGPATVFVGENGSGKSTLVEGLAMAYGLAAEGGSIYSRHRTRASESGLGDQLAVVRTGGASKGGYFLRAETMHSFFTYLEENPGSDPEEPLFHELSHGESFVALAEVKMKIAWPGLLILDEPESALSFDNQVRLLRHLQMLMATGRHQIVMSTHSPIFAALPGAVLYELDERGFHEADHDDATLVRNWRHFMNDPASFLDGHD